MASRQPAPEISFFQELPEHVQLRLLEVIPASGVTHLHYEAVR